jgi:hypothetical protein
LSIIEVIVSIVPVTPIVTFAAEKGRERIGH